MKSLARLFAPSALSILAPSPKGISITTYLAPIAPFFAITLAKSCGLGSIERGCSTFIILSSAGAMFVAPPQAITPPTFSVISFISSTLKFTFARTSIVSAVPLAEVIALLAVFGISNPAEATVGTIIRDILFPGTPPMLCLSTTIPLSKYSLSPLSIIALVNHSISSKSIPRNIEEITKDAISKSLKELFTIS